MAVLMCVYFTACSEDYGISTEDGLKKIKKIERSDPYTKHIIWNFNYDKSGKLLTVTMDNGEYTSTKNYTWKKNTIESSYETFTLNEGVISNYCNDKKVSYSYSTGKPIGVEFLERESYGHEYTFVWQDDGLNRRDIHYREGNRAYATESLRFLYDENATTCKYFNPIVPIFISEGLGWDFLCVAHPELVAACSTTLPSRFIKDDYYNMNSSDWGWTETRGTFSYKLDSEGYLIEYIMSEDSADEYAYEEKYTITWE